MEKEFFFQKSSRSLNLQSTLPREYPSHITMSPYAMGNILCFYSKKNALLLILY